MKIGAGRIKMQNFLASCILHLESPRSGFTIIETLVAMAVLVLAVAAPLTLAERSLASVEAANSEITALYLAQEAMEFVRNLRDKNTFGNKRSWLEGLNACIVSPGTTDMTNKKPCGVDPGTGTVTPCLNLTRQCLLSQYAGDNVLKNDPRYGIFGHSAGAGWKKTDFERWVSITVADERGGRKEAEVAVTVKWKAGSLGERRVTVETTLLNWQEEKAK